MPYKDRENNRVYQREKARERRASPEGRAGIRAAGMKHASSPQGRDRYLRKLYGISLTDYESMLAEQGFCCSICFVDTPCGVDERPKGQIKVWSVDHDHVTGKVRGLLCSRCNRALGMFNDSAALLRSAIHYLKEHA